MEPVDLLGMFMLGLLGTGHCIGMCGPLILAFPGRTGKFMPHVWYHLGRVATYAVVGGTLGGLGQLLAAAAAAGGSPSPGGMVWVKAMLWLLAAALLMLFGATRLGLWSEPGWLQTLTPERFPGFQKILGGAAGNRSQAAFFLMGALLGFLPCGLSYGAFAQALGTGSASEGTLCVLAFALGTTPGLLLLGTAVSAIFNRYRQPFDALSGVLMILMAFKLGHRAIMSLVPVM